MRVDDLRSFGEGLRRQQDPIDYSLRGVFLDAHGEFMNRRERYDPQIEFRGRVLPNQGINHEPGSFDLLGYDFDLDAPVTVSPDGYLQFGAYYLGRHYDFSRQFGTKGNGINNNLGDENLTAAGLKFGFGVFLDDNVLLEVQTRPGVWSDLDSGLHHKDFDFPSQALVTFRAMPNLFFKVGARYNQIYKDAPWLPYLGISWEIAEGVRFDLLAPEKFEFSFWPSSSTGFLLGSEVQGGEYHVRTSRSFGNQESDVRVQEVLGYVGLMHRFNDNISIMARSGAVFAGDYELTNGAASYNVVEGSLDTGWFAEISFGIDF